MNTISDPIYSLPISALKLSSRAANALNRAGIATIQELVNVEAEGLRKIRGIGATLSNEIEQKLAGFLESSEDFTYEKIQELKDPRPYLITENLDHPPNLVKHIEKLSRRLLYALGDQRDFEILKRRHGLEKSKIYTLQEVGYYYDLTRQRIRQLEFRAEQRIRDFLLGKEEFEEGKLPSALIMEANRLMVILKVDHPLLLESEILDILQERYSVTYSPKDLSALRFLLHILGLEQLSQNTTGIAHIKCHPTWLDSHSVDKKVIYTALSAVYKVLKKSVLSLSFFEITVRVNQRRKHRITRKYIDYALKICEEIEEISNERYQIKLEYLTSLADQVYRILYEQGTSMHIREIMRILNHHLVKAKLTAAKRVRLSSGTLSVDERFEPIGRSGKWSLAEWQSVRRETIVEIMKEFFHFSQKPASIDEVYEYVYSKRPDVSKASITIYLSSNKEEFTRISKNKYELAAWGGTPYETPKRFSPKEVTTRLTREIEAIFTERGTRKIPLTELINYLVKSTNVPRSTVYAWLRRSDLVTWEPGSSRGKLAEYSRT
jgi:DNA-directed RNA polymerase delta subunit